MFLDYLLFFNAIRDIIPFASPFVLKNIQGDIMITSIRAETNAKTDFNLNILRWKWSMH